MSKPHKHADIIHAWADGAKIQYIAQDGLTWIDTDRPGWCERDTYRIKPSVEIPEGFTPWDGVECPVKYGTIVDVIYRDGQLGSQLPANEHICDEDVLRDAGPAFWRSDNVDADIIAYKVIKKASVVRWQWVVKTPATDHPELTFGFYKDEAELAKHISNKAKIIGIAKWTRMEFAE